MRVVMKIVGHLFLLYVAIGIFFSGFGMMLGGPPRAKTVLAYFFLRPVYRLAHRLRAFVWSVIAMIWSIVVVHVLRPLWRGIKRLFRRPAPREPGWFRKWVWPS